jgi:hypothetical protein
VIPPGYRLALTVRGKDYEYPGGPVRMDHFKGSEMRGCGIYVHTFPEDRPPEVFDGEVTLHMGAGRDAYLQVPVIPVL